MFLKHKPDLVLLDLLLPGESGISLLRRIKKQEPNARVLVVTAVDQEKVDQELKELGVRGILRKPFDIMDLNASVSAALK